MRKSWILILLATSLATHAAPFDKERPRGLSLDQMLEAEQVGDEGKVELPASQTFNDWLKLPDSGNGAVVRVALDSLVSNADHSVLRYVVSMQPRGSTLQNVSFEGITCPTTQYRVYAWGKSEGGWLENRQPDWKLVNSARFNNWQATILLQACDGKTLRPLEQIRANLRQPPERLGLP